MRSETRPNPRPDWLRAWYEHKLSVRGIAQQVIYGRLLALLKCDGAGNLIQPADHPHVRDVFRCHDHILSQSNMDNDLRQTPKASGAGRSNLVDPRFKKVAEQKWVPNVAAPLDCSSMTKGVSRDEVKRLWKTPEVQQAIQKLNIHLTRSV